MKEVTYEIRIDDVTITVTKKRMKNVYLRVKKEDGSVHISAPHQMSREQIRLFAESRMEWIRTYQEKYAAGKERRGESPRPDPARIRQQKRLLKQRVDALVVKWEPVMGVHVTGITIRQMKTRWGSCNVNTHHININLALIDRPAECLEYVVVHEMTHLLEPSHNQVFWGYMTRFFPDWKRVRADLNRESQMN